MRRLCAMASLICGLTSGTLPARAEVAAAAPEANAVAAPAPASPEDDAAAWYERAETEWGNGDSRAARRSMQRAYELSGRPELLFNLGHLSRELGECEPALEFYRGYLDRVENAPRAAEARRAVQELQATCAPPPAPPPILPARVDDPGYWSTSRIAGWSALSLGATAAAGAVYFAISAARAERNLESLDDASSGGAVPWDESARDRQREGERAATLGRVFGVSAIALIVGGAFLVVADPRPSTAPPSVSVGVARDGVRAGYAVKF